MTTPPFQSHEIASRIARIRTRYLSMIWTRYESIRDDLILECQRAAQDELDGLLSDSEAMLLCVVVAQVCTEARRA
jgi:hypothetical protein